ncbi:hypothetical protein GCM10029963_02430 [Micromonospora andamanensis]
MQAGDATGQGGLAASGPADHGEAPSGGDGQVDLADHLAPPTAVAVHGAQTGDAQQRPVLTDRGHRSGRWRGEQLTGVPLSWCGEDLGGPAVFDGGAPVQHENLVGDGPYEVQVVAEQDDGDALAGQFRQFPGDVVAGERVLSGGGFVGDEQDGVGQQGVRDDEPLLLPPES